MNKVIFKTAMKTLFAVVIALIVAAAILCFGFPQKVADICEKTGNYSVATVFASLRYTYTGDTGELARCGEDSILSGDIPNTLRYCGKLVGTEDFGELCADKDGGSASGFYRQYIYGNYSSATYRSGNGQDAVKLAGEAMSGVAGFPVPNAYGTLAVIVGEAKDAETAPLLLEKIAEIVPSNNEKEIKYYNAVKKVLGD